MEDLKYSDFVKQYNPDRMKYIGSGGFAKVHKVFDHAHGRYVALKIADVRPELKQFTLKNEVELVNKLPYNANIARYDHCYRFDTGITGVQDFAILQYYEEGNLKQFLNKHRTNLDYEDKKHIIRGVLNGIAFLHSQNVIHRDLKSENILIQRESGMWTPKITDFGLSREVLNRETITNSSIGVSIAYAAPEQIQNQKILMNVDLWAAGVIMYYVMTGELPFQGRQEGSDRSSQSQLEISRKIINLNLPEKINEIDEPYQSMIRKCLVLDPRQRVQNAEELINMIRTYDPDGDKTVIIATPQKKEEPAAPYQPATDYQPYVDPTANPTIIQPVGRTIEPEEKKLVEEYTPPSSGDRPSAFSWKWLLVSLLLLAVAGVGYYYYLLPVPPEPNPPHDRYEQLDARIDATKNDSPALLVLVGEVNDLKNKPDDDENYRPSYLLAKVYAKQYQQATKEEQESLYQQIVKELNWAVNTANIGGDHESMRADFNEDIQTDFNFLSRQDKISIPTLLN